MINLFEFLVEEIHTNISFYWFFYRLFLFFCLFSFCIWMLISFSPLRYQTRYTFVFSKRAMPRTVYWICKKLIYSAFVLFSLIVVELTFKFLFEIIIAQINYSLPHGMPNKILGMSLQTDNKISVWNGFFLGWIIWGTFNDVSLLLGDRREKLREIDALKKENNEDVRLVVLYGERDWCNSLNYFSRGDTGLHPPITPYLTISQKALKPFMLPYIDLIIIQGSALKNEEEFVRLKEMLHHGTKIVLTEEDKYHICRRYSYVEFIPIMPFSIYDLDALVVKDEARQIHNHTCHEIWSKQPLPSIEKIYRIPILSTLMHQFWVAQSTSEKISILFNITEIVLKLMLIQYWIRNNIPLEHREDISKDGLNQLSMRLAKVLDTSPYLIDKEKIKQAWEWSIESCADRVSKLHVAHAPIPEYCKIIGLIAQLRNESKGHGVLTAQSSDVLVHDIFQLVLFLSMSSIVSLEFYHLQNQEGESLVYWKDMPCTEYLLWIESHQDVALRITQNKWLLYASGQWIRPTTILS